MKYELLYSTHIQPKNAHSAGVIMHPNVEKAVNAEGRFLVAGVIK
jgi:hypothetical protein